MMGMMDDDRKNRASMVLSFKKKKGEVDYSSKEHQDDMMEQKEEKSYAMKMAGSLIDAVKSGDEKATLQAFKDMMDCCHEAGTGSDY